MSVEGPPAVTPRPPRWAVWAAHAVPLCVLPMAVWRLAMGVGVPLGFSGELAELYEPGWVLTPYVVVLSLLTEGLAFLTLGLVRPWGEVFPRWMPHLGGRTVPTLGAVAAALAGAVAVMALGIGIAMSWNSPDFMGSPGAPDGFAYWVMVLAYLPALAWGPLLMLVTAAYYLRRRTPAPAADRALAGTSAPR